MNNLSEDPSFQSHEQGHATQETFHKQVSNMCDAIESMGNPFLNTTKEHTVLDTHDCMDEQVVEVLYKMEQLGKQQYSRYVSDVLVRREESIHSTIKRNNLSLFKRLHASTPSRKATQFQEMKSDCNLFSQLFIAAQVRDTNPDEFFSHENRPWPPALSLHGRLSLPGNKSDCCIASFQASSQNHHHTLMGRFSMGLPWCISCHTETSLRLANTATQSSFLGQRDNCKAALELTSYGTDTIQTV